MDDRTVRVALERHWDASDAGDFKVEHDIYREDAVLDYPQSGERIRGRHNIQESRFVQPNKKRFTVRRIIGSGDLWVTEFVLTYDGQPSYAVSIMEFREGLVANETQYFADRFAPAPSRAHLVERVGEITSSEYTPRRTRIGVDMDEIDYGSSPCLRRLQHVAAIRNLVARRRIADAGEACTNQARFTSTRPGSGQEGRPFGIVVQK